MKNPHQREAQVIASFGDEWSKFTNEITDDQRKLFEQYFSIFPWTSLPANPVGCDIGCGSGRFAYFVAQRVAALYCADPSSKALAVAKDKLAPFGNCKFLAEPADSLSIPDGSLDFAYCLGVLHHVADPDKSLRRCVEKLKPGAPFLLYLYYRLENKPWWFRALWRLTTVPRMVISSLPFKLKALICEVIAAVVYWPLARAARWLEGRGRDVSNFPLSIYRDKAFYILRNDALDRFGTSLEKRFTRAQIHAMMDAACLDKVAFREAPPYWCAVGYRCVPSYSPAEPGTGMDEPGLVGKILIIAATAVVIAVAILWIIFGELADRSKALSAWVTRKLQGAKRVC